MKKFPAIMEPTGALLGSQEPTTALPQILFKIHFNVVLSMPVCM
jgi:hypothetical protein